MRYKMYKWTVCDSFWKLWVGQNIQTHFIIWVQPLQGSSARNPFEQKQCGMLGLKVRRGGCCCCCCCSPAAVVSFVAPTRLIKEVTKQCPHPTQRPTHEGVISSLTHSKGRSGVLLKRLSLSPAYVGFIRPLNWKCLQKIHKLSTHKASVHLIWTLTLRMGQSLSCCRTTWPGQWQTEQISGTNGCCHQDCAN